VNCKDHKRFTGKTDPSKRKDPEGRTCKTCWEIYYKVQGIPYDADTMRSLAKVHTQYFQKNGNQVQGVTTIIGNHDGDKGGLIHAAWKLGLEGINYREEWQQKAKTGTIAHDMIRAHLQGMKIDFKKFYPGHLVERAENGFLGYLEWEAGLKHFKPILIEKPLVSEKLPWGCTLDLYAEVNDYLTLIDFKTGKAIYGSGIVQVAATAKGMLPEHGYEVERTKILHLKATDNMAVPEFHEYNYADHTLLPAWKWFQRICSANQLYLQVFKGWK
jgi:hypothetical protein